MHVAQKVVNNTIICTGSRKPLKMKR